MRKLNTNKLHTAEHAALLGRWLQSGFELGITRIRIST
jgi:hypothetical protein